MVFISSEKENINTIETDSEILITMLSAFAQAESESISANVRWGVRQSMREGKVNFQYSKMFGYERGEDNKPRIVPEQAEIVRGIFKSYLAGDSVKMIKESLDARQIKTSSGSKPWSVSAIQGMLRNEKYCGDALLQKTFREDCISGKAKKNTGQLPKYLVRNNHEGIIDRRIFDAVQTEIARRTGTKSRAQKNSASGMTKYSSQYALTDRLVCGECGTLYRRCIWSRGGKKRIVWRCISRLDYGTEYCKDSPTIDEEPLHKAILDAVNIAMSKKEQLIIKLSDAIKMELSPEKGKGMSLGDIDRRIEEIGIATDKLLKVAAESGSFESYRDEFRTLATETEELKVRRESVLQRIYLDDKCTRRISGALDATDMTEPIFTQWDDSIIRQLVDTVKVVGADRVEVWLKSGEMVEERLGG